MACCLFADIPPATLQVVLQHLSLRDHASVRRVNRLLLQHTTQHVPYITMSLCASSTATQLQTWNQVTQRLQHVTSVHVLLDGKIAADIFDLAMQLLSQRTSKIAELHLIGINLDPIGVTTSVPSLQHIFPILTDLKKLALEGFAADVPLWFEELAKSAPSGGWQLQSLVLHPIWSHSDDSEDLDPEIHWSGFTTALQYLTEAFPALAHLDMKFPRLRWMPLLHYNEPSAYEVLNAINEAYDPPGCRGDYRQGQLAQATAVTAVANAVQQLQQLKAVKVTSMPDIWKQNPTSICGYEVRTHNAPSASVSAATAPLAAAAAVNAKITDGLLSSVSAAAEAFGTLDECGCWLLQQHPGLKQASISVHYNCGWAFTWYRQQQQPSSTATLPKALQDNQTTTTTELAPDIACCVDVATCDFIDRVHSNAPTDSSSSVTSRFEAQLSQYSHRAASSLMDNMSSCNLTLSYKDAASLADLLHNLRSLKHLKVLYRTGSVEADDDSSTMPAMTVIKAAASMQKLQSLTLEAESCDFDVSDPLLQPLTAAAGGPGYSLKKLDLSLHIGKPTSDDMSPAASAAAAGAPAAEDEAASDQASTGGTSAAATQRGAGSLQQVVACMTLGTTADDATPAGRNTIANIASTTDTAVQGTTVSHTAVAAVPAVTTRPAAVSSKTSSSSSQQLPDQHDAAAAPADWLSSHEAVKAAAVTAHAAVSGDVAWHHALCQLNGLHELNIQGGFDLPVESLPASLKVLRGTELNIISESSSAVADAHGACASSATMSLANDLSELEHEAEVRPQLSVLDLQKCQMSSPSILASSQLQQLKLISSTWSGGWAAAGAAWPCLQELTWQFNEEYETTSCLTSSNPEAASSLQAMVTSLGGSNCDIIIMSGKTVTSAAIARWFSETVTISCPVLEDVAAAFPNVKDFIIQNLPWVTVELLKPVMHHMRDLQQISIKTRGARRLGLTAYGFVMLRDRASSNSTGVSLKHPDIRLVQQRLQQEFPWARVFVE